MFIMLNPFIEKSCFMTILNPDDSLYQDFIKNPCEVDLSFFSDKLHELIADMRVLFGNDVIIRLEFKV